MWRSFGVCGSFRGGTKNAVHKYISIRKFVQGFAGVRKASEAWSFQALGPCAGPETSLFTAREPLGGPESSLFTGQEPP